MQNEQVGSYLDLVHYCFDPLGRRFILLNWLEDKGEFLGKTCYCTLCGHMD